MAVSGEYFTSRPLVAGELAFKAVQETVEPFGPPLMGPGF